MSDIQFTRLPGYDVNGNPRYVCHYLHLLTEAEKTAQMRDADGKLIHPTQYEKAIQRARLIGGMKYRAKWYGGGIVFTDYENVIKAAIKAIVADAEKEAQS